MERNAILGIVAFAVVVLGVAGFAAAQGGFGFGKNLDSAATAEMQAKHEATQDAIANKDYAAWKSLMNSRISEMQSEVTEENFNQMVERHNQMQEMRTVMQEARESGDFSKVEELREQYGIEGGFGSGKMKGPGGVGCPMHETASE